MTTEITTIVAKNTIVGYGMILGNCNEKNSKEITMKNENTITINHTTMEDIMTNDIKLKSSIARGAFDPDAWVVSEMNSTTAEAWGWYEDPDTGRREIDPTVRRFWSWQEAAAEFAPAARVACWGEGMTDEEVEDVADAMARKACAWIGRDRPVEEWLQVKPALAEAGDDDPAMVALMESAVAEVLADRA